MNERIKKLPEDAGFRVESWMTNPPKPKLIVGNIDSVDVFAKSIVRECIDTLGTHEDYWTHEQSMNELKRHFGIE